MLLCSFIISSCSRELPKEGEKQDNITSTITSTASPEPTREAEATEPPIKPKEENILLHYILPEGFENRYIGDVHPFFDEKSQTWYMFYLDTSGNFHSKLLTSKDGISWEPTEIKIKSMMENYAVLGIVPHDEKYYSYYGDYHTSVSEDLLNWSYAGSSYKAFQDKEQFPGGCRDPFVAYDQETDRFYSIAINYPKRVFSENIYIANLAVGHTNSGSLEDWSKEAKPVLSENSNSHDPECPQLIKIGSRWYVFTSFYGFSQHGVGKLAYLIGDEGLDPYSVDWQSKEINYLTSEDICAAQVTQKGEQFFLFGWLPKDYTGGHWGGHINLPTEVYPLPDGRLRTRLDKETSQRIRGENYYKQSEEIALDEKNELRFTAEKRTDLELHFEMKADDFTIEIPEKKVVIKIQKSGKEALAIVYSNTYLVSSIAIDEEDLAGECSIRMISESNMLEIYINDAYYMPARIGVKLGNDDFVIKSSNAVIKTLEAFSLRTLEQIQNKN